MSGDIQRRITVTMLCFLATGMLFLGRLAWLQLVMGSYHAATATRFHTRTIYLESGIGARSRGQILDRNLNPLTGGDPQPGLAVFLSVGRQEHDAAEFEDWVEYLTELTGLSKSELEERSRKGLPLPLARETDVTLPHWVKPVVWERDENLNLRRYTYGQLARHTLGILIDNQGVLGLEAMFNRELLTERRGISAFTDVNNSLIPGLSYRITGAAVSLVTTLDLEVQQVVEDVWDSFIQSGQVPPEGAIVVMDPGTGEILAMASRPVIWGVSNHYNRAVRKSPNLTSSHPASVIKVLTAAVALDQNPALAKGRYTCSGSISYGNNTFKCHNNHGELDLAGALSASCNVYFAQLANELDPRVLLDTARALGLGTRPSLPLPSVELDSGGIPQIKDLATGAGIVNHFALGANKLEATPVQIALLVSAIANGGYKVEPSLVWGVGADPTRLSAARVVKTRVFTQRTALTVGNMMNQAVLERERLYNLATYPLARTLATKTGTADVSGSQGYELRWNAGFFPVDSPRYTVVYMAEVPRGWHTVQREALLAAITHELLARE